MTETERDASVTALVRLIDKLYDRLDNELAAINERIDAIDHETVKRGPFEELHTRVDEQAAALGNLVDQYVAGIRDDADVGRWSRKV